jgi:hypothetical protein
VCFSFTKTFEYPFLQAVDAVYFLRERAKRHPATGSVCVGAEYSVARDPDVWWYCAGQIGGTPEEKEFYLTLFDFEGINLGRT